MARIRLDHAGIAAVLKSADVADEMETLAQTIAAAVEQDPSVVAHDVPVEVTTYTTDRAAAAVTLAHPGGLPIEAKHAPLARAAGDAGLDVRSREDA